MSVSWTWCSISTRWAPWGREGDQEGRASGVQTCIRCRGGSCGWGVPLSHAGVSPHSPFAQVYTVVDEMFLAGEIRETSQTKVLKQLLMLQSLE